MVRVGILGEDDELARIVGPVAQRVKVKRAPERCGCRRRLDASERVAMAHTPPTFHIALHSSRHVHGDVTVHRNHTRHHGVHGAKANGDGAQTLTIRVRAPLGRPSQGSSELVEPYSPGAHVHHNAAKHVLPSLRKTHGVGAEPEQRTPEPTGPGPDANERSTHRHRRNRHGNTARYRGGMRPTKREQSGSRLIRAPVGK